MLNLTKPVIYERAQKDHVKSLVDKLGKRDTSGGRKTTVDGPFIWGLSVRTLKHQFGRCAFCEELLREGNVELEHIVPKSKHGKYTYEPLNIVSSCSSCNSMRKKGNADTIMLPLAGRYKDNRFLIVHPYLDNPDDHIKYQDEDKTLFDLDNCTNKGKWTIDLFKWDNPCEFNHRVMVARSRDLPALELKELLQISTYK